MLAALMNLGFAGSGASAPAATFIPRIMIYCFPPMLLAYLIVLFSEVANWLQ